MTKGYIILAQDSINPKIDYHRMAYALALSIKNTQSTVSDVTLITDKNVNLFSNRYHDVFDNIIELPWGDHAKLSKWKIENKWKYYHATPYDETVVLDADMVFTSDVSSWWDLLSSKEICLANTVNTFRGEVASDDHYRKTFTSNDLPNIYTAFMYFKKTEMSAELFKLTEIIFKNWERFYYDYLDETRPKQLSGDVAYALAIKLLGIEKDCTFSNSVNIPSFVHMKSKIQNIPERFITEDWTLHLPTYFTENGILKIGNYQQHLPFHYQIKEWLTDDIIHKLEGIYNK